MMKKNKFKKLFKNKTSRLVLALVALGIFAILHLFCIKSPIRETVFFTVAPGASVSSIAADLEKQNIVNSSDIFKVCVIISGGRVQSGTYEIPANASSARIAIMMNRGKIAMENIMIPEGLTVKQVEERLADRGECHPLGQYKDGELFPDTYRVPRGASCADIMNLMNAKMIAVRESFEKSGKNYPKPLKSWNDVITLASIIQKETPKVSEMPLVASVYINRLKKQMKLQADPTVVYAITNGYGDMDEKFFKRQYLKMTSPYNTYIHYGLPPAPIANVGRAAIMAALRPADTNYLYFVADGSGGHKFSRTYAEHQKNHIDWRVKRNK